MQAEFAEEEAARRQALLLHNEVGSPTRYFVTFLNSIVPQHFCVGEQM